MKSINYVQREERNIESLLEMLDQSTLRIANGKDVPPYMLREIIELLQTYIDGPHKMREDMILTSLYDRRMDVPIEECDEIHNSLSKYERFLLRVVEAYDLGYHGSKSVFAHYAKQYTAVLRQYIRLVNGLLAKWVDGQEQRDKQVLRELKKIDGRAKKIRERRIIRVEILQKELRTVAA